MVEVGGHVTLRCPVSEKEGKFFQWYKQPLGYMVQTVATGSFKQQRLSEQFKNSRFEITEGADEYALIIRNVTKEDEATYFCQNGTAYLQSFAAGFYLVVKGKFSYKLAFFFFFAFHIGSFSSGCKY